MNIWLASAFVLLLLLCSISDIKKRIIPNQLVILLLALGLLQSWLYFYLADALLGLLFPSILLFLAKSKWNFYIGAGDIKLLSAIGIWVGWHANIYVLLAGGVLALVYAGIVGCLRRGQASSIPFAPFLSAAAIAIYAGLVVQQL